jgi:hypothetical protein
LAFTVGIQWINELCQFQETMWFLCTYPSVGIASSASRQRQTFVGKFVQLR